MGLAPWNDSRYLNSIAQLNLGSNSNNKLEVVSLLNVQNISVSLLYYHYTNCPIKYNPRVYLGYVETYAKQWNQDTQNISQKPNSKGPESYQQSL